MYPTVVPETFALPLGGELTVLQSPKGMQRGLLHGIIIVACQNQLSTTT